MRAVSLALAAGFMAACSAGSVSAVDPTATATIASTASPTPQPTATPVPTPTASPQPNWTERPVIANDAAALAAQLVMVEAFIHDPKVGGDQLAWAGHAEQLCIARLADYPEWTSQVLAAL